MDFPIAPIVGQKYTAPSGVVYAWDGYGWTVGFYDSGTQEMSVVGDVLDQVRTLLQDVDNSSGQYRYSTDSIITALNQGMLDLFRIRPDLFLESKFKVPVFSVGALNALFGIEEQYVPPLVYYVVGLVQVRDDEQNQDQRAMAFLKTFTQAVLTVG
jgi:hypothetical protein